MDIYDDIVPELGYYAHRICDEKWRIQEKRIDFVDLTYILKGEAEYIVEGISHKLTAGDLLCAPMGSMRLASTSPHNPMECYCLNLSVRDLEGRDKALPFNIVNHVGFYPDILSLYRELDMVLLRQNPSFRLKARGLISLIIYRYLEIIVYENHSEHMDARISRVVASISDNYSEKLSLEPFARELGLNPAYFGTLFKKVMKMSFQQYLESVRMNAAEDMLRGGGYSVSEVASSCGFTDVFYFSKIFKKNFGVLPSKIKKKQADGSYSPRLVSAVSDK